MTASPTRSASTPLSAEPEAISLLAIANTVLHHRYLVGATALLVPFLVGLVMLIVPRDYTAESAFMLQSRPNVPASLSGLASQFGLSLPTGEANQSPAFYAELFQSREILRAVVDTPLTLHEGGTTQTRSLAEWLDVSGSTPALQRDKAIKKLKKRVAVSTSAKTGVVTLQVTTHNPELSALISERMLEWLNEFNLRKRQSQASAERRFTEARLEEAERQRRDAEDRLLAFAQRNRVTTSPLLSLEQDRLQREVAMRQQVYTSVAQAYDRAKIEEVRDTPVITILQPPEQPVRPDPRRLVIKVILMGMVGFVIGAWLASLRDTLHPRPVTGMTPQEEFAVLSAEIRDDFRHPRRTLGRLLRLGGRPPPADGRTEVGSPA